MMMMMIYKSACIIRQPVIIHAYLIPWDKCKNLPTVLGILSMTHFSSVLRLQNIDEK